jgi:chemotaxis protein methyltransferase CheR
MKPEPVLAAPNRINFSSNASIVAGEFIMTSQNFQHIADMLFSDAGIELPQSKAMLVYSRLAKRLRELQFNSFNEYCDFAAGPNGADERRKMLSALTTNVTSFFRENHHFEHLKSTALPSLLQRAQNGGRVRIWSAGCSTGQEPYSIALTLLAMEPKAAQLDIRILATDIDPQVLQFGSIGIYDPAALNSVPPELKRTYFTPTEMDGEQGWRVGEVPRKLITFMELNLNGAWPMKGKFDIIFCRNVVIYFSTQTQQVIWNNMAGKIVPGSWLYIGHSERVSGPVTPDFISAGVTTYRYKAKG